MRVDNSCIFCNIFALDTEYAQQSQKNNPRDNKSTLEDPPMLICYTVTHINNVVNKKYTTIFPIQEV